VCTDKGTAGESRCRKAKGLTEFFFARQPVAKRHIVSSFFGSHKNKEGGFFMMKTKKKSGKRFLSWLLAAVMIIALMPATAFA